MSITLAVGIREAYDKWEALTVRCNALLAETRVLTPQSATVRAFLEKAGAWHLAVTTTAGEIFKKSADRLDLFRVLEDPAFTNLLHGGVARIEKWFLLAAMNRNHVTKKDMENGFTIPLNRHFGKASLRMMRVLKDIERKAEKASTSFGAVLEASPSPLVREQYKKLLVRRGSDVAGASTTARSLLETVAKHALEEHGARFDNNDSAGKLCSLAMTALGVHAKQVTGEVQVLSQLVGHIADKLGTLRNDFGDAHGKDSSSPRLPSPAFAWLLADLAMALSTFVETIQSESARRSPE